MKIIDKTDGKEVRVDHPNTMKQFQNLFGCRTECRNHCAEAMKIKVYDVYGREKIKKLCELTFKNEPSKSR